MVIYYNSPKKYVIAISAIIFSMKTPIILFTYLTFLCHSKAMVETAQKETRGSVWCVVFFEENKDELFLAEGKVIRRDQESNSRFLIVMGKVLNSSKYGKIGSFKVLESACSEDKNFSEEQLSLLSKNSTQKETSSNKSEEKSQSPIIKDLIKADKNSPTLDSLGEGYEKREGSFLKLSK